jgi:MFS family permease
MIMFTTYAVYYVSTLKLNPLQLVLVGTVIELTVFLCEIPTGVVADAYSRKVSVIISMFVMAGAYLLEGAIPYLGALYGIIPAIGLLMLAETIRGFGWTFQSGALDAWLADEVGEDAVGEVFLRAEEISRIAGLVGVAISVGLSSISLNIPYLAGGGLHVAMGIIVLTMLKETNFKPTPRDERGNFTRMKATLADGLRSVRSNPVLLSLVAVTLFAGAASEGIDRLWTAHMLSFALPIIGTLNPVVWFGIIRVVTSISGIFSARFARKSVNTANQSEVRRWLVGVTALRLPLLVAFGLAGNFTMAVVAFCAMRAVDSISQPLFNTWLNQNVESGTRATVLSMVGQTDAIGQVGGGPIVGFVGNRYSLRAAMLLSALFLSPVLAVYARAKKHISAGISGQESRIRMEAENAQNGV